MTPERIKRAKESALRYRLKKASVPLFQAKCRAAVKRWYLKSGKAKMAFSNRVRKLRFLYKLSLEQFDAMMAAQDSKCLICSKGPSLRHRKLNVDHCHRTGVVRGLLCDRCNGVLGWIENDAERFENAMRRIVGKRLTYSELTGGAVR